MPLIKLLTNNGHIHELNVKTIFEIDGVPYSESSVPDIDNHEVRIRNLERLVSNALDFLDEKFPSPPGVDLPDVTVSDPVILVG